MNGGCLLEKEVNEIKMNTERRKFWNQIFVLESIKAFEMSNIIANMFLVQKIESNIK